MAVAQFQVSGNYPAYVNAGVLTADITGDWIRVPANARGITFRYKNAATGTPVGTVGVDVHFGADPTDGKQIALSLTGTVAINGAADDYIRVSFMEPALGRPTFIRGKYTRGSGGTGGTQTWDAVLGVE